MGMFRGLSQPQRAVNDAIRAELHIAAMGAFGRVAFAAVVAVASLRWLPPVVAFAYFALAALWEFRGRIVLADVALARIGPNRARLRAFYRLSLLFAASFYASVPLVGLLSGQVLGWYVAIIAFCWATVVGVTYFSHDKWLFAACVGPFVLLVSVAPFVFHVPPFVTLASYLLHAVFMMGAIHSAIHRSDLVKRAAKQENERLRAEKANLEKSRFIANISHELLTPLNTIVGYGELLQEAAADGRLAREEQADLEQILLASSYLMTLIGELLDVSKLEAGRLTLDVGRFDVAQAIRQALKKAQPHAGDCQIVVDSDALGGLRHATGDEHRTTQCVYYMLMNAVGAAPRGRVTLTARSERSDGRDWLVIEVADNGRPRTPEEIAALLDPFAQGAQGRDVSSLGVAITHRVARLIGGDANLTSNAEAGSVFTLRLPATISEQTDAAHPLVKNAA